MEKLHYECFTGGNQNLGKLLQVAQLTASWIFFFF